MGKKFKLIFFCSLLTAVLFAEEKLSSAEFLARARRPNPVDTFAMLSGKLQHRRGGAPESMSVYFGIIIQKERSTGQLVFAGKEGYLLGQAKQKGGSSVIPMQKSSDLIDRTGVRASDLTLDFLYYDFLKEDKEETLGGFVSCRVMLLQSQDKKEFAKVYLSSTHYFPLKVEFFKTGEKTPWRTLETGGFTQKNDLYYIRRLRLEGPGWRTRIEFDEADLGLYDPKNPPKNLIRKLPLK